MPPSYLLRDCETPRIPDDMAFGTLREYAVGATYLLLEYEAALELCNADKAALRRWYESVKHEQ